MKKIVIYKEQLDRAAGGMPLIDSYIMIVKDLLDKANLSSSIDRVTSQNDLLAYLEENRADLIFVYSELPREEEGYLLGKIRESKKSRGAPLFLCSKCVSASSKSYFQDYDLSALVEAGDPKTEKVLGQALNLWINELSSPRSAKRFQAKISEALGLGLLGDALALAKEFRELAPHLPESSSLLGAVLLERGEYSKALPLLRESVTLAPNNPRILSILGKALLMSNLPDEALSLFEKADLLNPGNFKRLLDLGDTHYQRGDVESAEEYYADAEAIAPNDREMEVRSNAVSLVSEGVDLQRLNETMREKLTEKERARLMNNAAVCLARRKESERASSIYDLILSSVQDNYILSRVHYNKGIAFKRVGQNKEALEHLSKAVDIDPDFLKASKKKIEVESTPGILASDIVAPAPATPNESMGKAEGSLAEDDIDFEIPSAASSVASPNQAVNTASPKKATENQPAVSKGKIIQIRDSSEKTGNPSSGKSSSQSRQVGGNTEKSDSLDPQGFFDDFENVV
jgi:tetratricopeptide (TPR) repeat protein